MTPPKARRILQKILKKEKTTGRKHEGSFVVYFKDGDQNTVYRLFLNQDMSWIVDYWTQRAKIADPDSDKSDDFYDRGEFLSMAQVAYDEQIVHFHDNTWSWNAYRTSGSDNTLTKGDPQQIQQLLQSWKQKYKFFDLSTDSVFESLASRLIKVFRVFFLK